MDACLPASTAAADPLVAAYLAGHKALFFGYGGSAADATPGCGICGPVSPPAPARGGALAFNANASDGAAIGKDHGYKQVFARELEALGAPG